MSTFLNGLKLVNTKRNTTMPLVMQRRNKLVKMIFEQMELCKALQAGSTYAPTRLRTVKNKETGERVTLQMPKRVRAWYWLSENSKICLSIKYGTKVVELAKGKTAIELDSAEELLPTLEKIKQAVETGELDSAIEVVSGAVKRGFKKK